MIRISKRLRAPAILRDPHRLGPRTTKQLMDAYDSDPASYDSGFKKFIFKSSIYAAKSVKNALINDQHGKCCFCESKTTDIAYGDVEHFRPKKGWKQQDGDTLERPGYYWLAYDWNNLFLSCQICNQRYKGNLFPLKEGSARASNHYDDIGEEKPLLVSPGAEPETHIRFFADEAVGNTNAGKETVVTLGLNRDALRERRMASLESLRVIKRASDMLSLLPQRTPNQEEILSEMLEKLEQSQKDSAEYTSMMRSFLAQN